jgi:hypothetical protein
MALATGSVGAAPNLSVGSLSGTAGKTVTLPVRFDPAASSISSLQFNLMLPKGVSPGSVTPGPILNSAGKSVKTHLKGQAWEILIFGINQNTIPSGDLLTAQVKIAPGTPAGNLAVPISGVAYTDPSGNVVNAGQTTGGSVTVVGPKSSQP